MSSTINRATPFAGGAITAAAVATPAALGSGPTLGLLAAALVPAALAAATDVRVGRLPDRLVVLCAVPSSVWLVAAVVDGSGRRAAAGLAGGVLLMALPLLLLHLWSPAALGFGDVKLAAALGAAVGLATPGSAPAVALLALAVAAGATAIVGLAARRVAVPLGPGLVAGAVIALVVAGHVGEAPVPWR